MPRASRACAVLVAILVLAVVMVSAAHASPVTVDGTFLSFTSSILLPSVRPASVNGIPLTTPGTTTIIDPNTGQTQYRSNPVSFTGPTTRLDFQYDTAPNLLNSFEWIPNTANVNVGDTFQFGTIRFTNGQWFYQADIRVSLTSHSADPALDGHLFSGTIRLISNQDVTLPVTPDDEADFFYFAIGPNLGSARVYDLFRQPPSLPGNVGDVALMGHIGSLIPTGFVALNDAVFISPSTEPGPLPHGEPVPEPGTLALLGTALTALSFIRRLRR